MLTASYTAPSNALLATCRTIYHEARSIFMDAQRTFWQQSTFAIPLTDNDGVNAPVLVDYPELVRNRHFEEISSVVIEIEKVYDTRIYMISGLGAEWQSDNEVFRSWNFRIVSDNGE